MNTDKLTAAQDHILSVLVENRFGVLARVAGMFSGRGFNIESLSVAPTLDPTMSHMTIVTTGDEFILEQIIKQLRRLIDVIRVAPFRGETFVEREMVLLRVRASEQTRAEVLRVVEIFRAKVVDVGQKFYVLEVTGSQGKIRAMIDLLTPIGIEEVVRTGRVAMLRSAYMQDVRGHRRGA